MKVSEFLALDDRERDAFVQHFIGGDTLVSEGVFIPHDGTPEYTTTWEGMRRVVERMEYLGYYWAVRTWVSGEKFITFEHNERLGLWGRTDKSAPLATCIAAGLALGVLEAD